MNTYRRTFDGRLDCFWIVPVACMALTTFLVACESDTIQQDSADINTATHSAKPVSSLIVLEGAVFDVAVWGAGGETILALPGNGADTSWYQFIAPRIAAAGYRFVTMNPRGVGESKGLLDDLSVEMMANDVAGVIGALETEKIHLIGWAFGNRIARATSTIHPDLIETVTLVAAGGLVKPSEGAEKARAQVSTPNNFSEEKMIELYKASFFSPTSNVMEILESVRPGVWPEARAAQSAAMANAERSEWWSGGDVKMLVVQGLDDKIAVPANGYALKEEFPERVTLVDIPNAGHMLLAEQPNDIAENIIIFLKENRISGGAKSD